MLNKEILQEKGIELSEEGLNAINEVFASKINESRENLSKEFSGNQDSFLDKVANTVNEGLGVGFRERGKGEKFADYLKYLSQAHVEKALSKERQELSAKRQELEEKMKNQPSKIVEEEYNDLKKREAEALQKLAEMSDYEDVKSKAEKYATELSAYKTDAAFSVVQPALSEKVDKDIFGLAWGNFKKNILEDYDISEIKDNDVTLASKSNELVTVSLSSLVAKDPIISKLTQDSPKKSSINGREAKSITLDGMDISLEIPEGANKDQIERIVQRKSREIAESKNDGKTYGKKFTDEFNKALKAFREQIKS